MNFNDLLIENEIDPATTLVLRHRPKERKLRQRLGWLAGQDHEVFNAYQQTQPPIVERKFKKATHIASCIGEQAGKALFVGIYKNRGHKATSKKERAKFRGQRELSKYDLHDPSANRLWFDLRKTKHLEQWSGKLVVSWNSEISWTRWAGSNSFEVLTIHEESRLSAPMPDWSELVFEWNDLSIMPSAYRDALRQWRGIYYIFDVTDGKGYVGAAYGKQNILGRWKIYATNGHGNNRKLRERKPENLRFTILERMGPDALQDEVCDKETSWKIRLHTREHGLNDN